MYSGCLTLPLLLFTSDISRQFKKYIHKKIFIAKLNYCKVVEYKIKTDAVSLEKKNISFRSRRMFTDRGHVEAPCVRFIFRLYTWRVKSLKIKSSEDSLAVLIVRDKPRHGHCHMPCAISLQLRHDRYKLLPWHLYALTLCRRAASCLWIRASLSTRPRLPKLLRSRTPYYRHAPCPKHGAQMTTMMNTPRASSIHDESQRTDRTSLITSAGTDWRRDILGIAENSSRSDSRCRRSDHIWPIFIENFSLR